MKPTSERLRGSALAALVLGSIAVTPGVARACPQAQVPARPPESTKPDPVEPSPKLPLLKRLGTEIAELRRMANCRVRIDLDRGLGRESTYGAYLGEGIVVVPRVEGESVGSTATMRWESDAYRLVRLEDRLPWVTFYKLRDWPLEQQPAPPVLPDEDGLDSGLVLVVGPQHARLAIAERWRFGDLVFRRRPERSAEKPAERVAEKPPERAAEKPPERGAEARPRGDRRWVGVYTLADTDSTPGSVVMTTDGELLGLMVRPTWPPRPEPRPEPRPATEVRAGGEQRPGEQRPGETGASPEVSSRPREAALVLPTRRLLEQGRLAMAKPLPENIAPKLGITLWHPGPDGGQRVSTVAVGCPACKAGVQVNDVWLKVNDQPLRRNEQMRDLLKASKSGDLIKVVYRRGKEEREVSFKL